jgi:hypothetical protein
MGKTIDQQPTLSPRLQTAITPPSSLCEKSVINCSILPISAVVMVDNIYHYRCNTLNISICLDALSAKEVFYIRKVIENF